MPTWTIRRNSFGDRRIFQPLSQAFSTDSSALRATDGYGRLLLPKQVLRALQSPGKAELPANLPPGFGRSPLLCLAFFALSVQFFEFLPNPCGELADLRGGI
jgi:hypothetical protein